MGAALDTIMAMIIVRSFFTMTSASVSVEFLNL